MLKYLLKFVLVAACGAVSLFANGVSNLNQTPTVTPIITDHQLQFSVQVGLADFSLPNGLHSYAQAVYQGKWLFLAGRTNGLHGFSDGNNNFPPSTQNKVVYVVDPVSKTVFSRSLNDPSSGLSQLEIDLLSVTSPQSYYIGPTLYITGGYGVESATGLFSTKNCLSAIDIPGLMHWVIASSPSETAAQHIRQLFHPVFQVTGGYMTKIRDNPTLLVFGQNFAGYYHSDSNGFYTEQVRRFNIIDDGVNLGVQVLPSRPSHRQEPFRRRDLNVVPVIHKKGGRYRQQLIAFSGVFTIKGGIWTVPVVISSSGKCEMKSSYLTETFKQGMNNYACPTVGLFSKNNGATYTIFLGGISYGYFEGGEFQTDPEIPFINQITTVKYDQEGNFSQYLMDAEYPVILSTQSNPGNPLLFGAGAQFIPANENIFYGNGVINLDVLKEPTVVGYVVGGIQSTLPNTNGPSDSAASPYIFKVTITPAVQ